MHVLTFADIVISPITFRLVMDSPIPDDNGAVGAPLGLLPWSLLVNLDCSH